MVACRVRVLADDVSKRSGGILVIQDEVCLKDNRELVYSALFSRVKELDRLLERKGETMPRNDYKRLTDERDKTFVLLGRYSKH